MIWKANKNKKSQCQHLLAPFLIVSLLGSACSFKSHKEPPNTLHLSVPEKIKGLDPIYAEDLYSGTVLAQSYETLLGYHYLKRPYSLTPQLAEKMPEVSSDGLTYTFHLRKEFSFRMIRVSKQLEEKEGSSQQRMFFILLRGLQILNSLRTGGGSLMIESKASTSGERLP